MKADLQQPTIVILGSWNPAIFNPNWIGLHLFGFEEGRELTVQIVETDAPQKRRIFFMENIGIAARATRLELFLMNLDCSTIEQLEAVSVRIFEKLPHTPTGSIGINFGFLAPTNEQVRAKLQVADGSTELFPMKELTVTTRFTFTPGIDLNLRRTLRGGEIEMGFNYHHHDANSRNGAALIRGKIGTLLDESKKILQELYSLELDEEPRLLLPTAPGEG